MPTTPNYVLKAGVVLSDGFGSSNFYTLSNIPDEVAEKHLAQYPNDIDLFERTPSDWEARANKKKIELGIASDDEPIDLEEVKKAAAKETQSATEKIETPSDEEDKPTLRRGRPLSK